jgi:hypothetical protein
MPTPEKQPFLSSITRTNNVSPIERVTQSAGQSAHYWGLDPLTSEALEKFAVLNYRIREIKEDFVGKTTTRVLYRIDSWASSGFAYGVTIRQGDYAYILRLLSATAFNLYDTYLSKDNSAAEAAQEIKQRIDDLFPKTPLATFLENT